MKPFNLELAKAGHPVCTKDGYPVELFYFNYRHSTGQFQIAGIIHYEDRDLSTVWTNNGEYSASGLSSDRDLVMASQKKSVWKNFYINEEGIVRCGISYLTKSEAINHANILNNSDFGKYICTQKIEWDE